jgi:Glycosyl transferase family 2
MTSARTPKLSICIPTYNRESFLRDTLLQLVRCMEHAGPQSVREVEIVVLDNASSDGTTQLVAQFAHELPNIRHRRHDSNIGVEKNIVLALQEGRGDWVWPLGDDDLLSDDALTRILHEIDDSAPSRSLLLLNYAQADASAQQVLSSRVCDVPDDWEGDLFGPCGLHRYGGSFDLLAFISAIVVRRGALSFEVDYASFKSYYGHIGNVAAGVARGGVKVLGPGLMTQRQGNIRTDASEPNAATVLVGSDTFAGVALMLRALVDGCPEAGTIHAMSVKTGLNEIEDCGSKLVTQWAFDVFAKPHLVACIENDQMVVQDQLLGALLPLMQPAQVRGEIERFRRQWLACRAALSAYQAMRAGL